MINQVFGAITNNIQIPVTIIRLSPSVCVCVRVCVGVCVYNYYACIH